MVRKYRIGPLQVTVFWRTGTSHDAVVFSALRREVAIVFARPPYVTHSKGVR